MIKMILPSCVEEDIGNEDEIYKRKTYRNQ